MTIHRPADGSEEDEGAALRHPLLEAHRDSDRDYEFSGVDRLHHDEVSGRGGQGKPQSEGDNHAEAQPQTSAKLRSAQKQGSQPLALRPHTADASSPATPQPPVELDKGFSLPLVMGLGHSNAGMTSAVLMVLCLVLRPSLLCLPYLLVLLSRLWSWSTGRPFAGKAGSVAVLQVRY